MAEEPDVIRHRIDETRESLAEKLETLEGQVKEVVGSVTSTIESVKTTVENTVGTVKSSVSETVDTVKETFDLPSQVQRHPWGAVGCSLLAGAAAGYLLTGPRRYRSHNPDGIPGMEHLIPGYQPARSAVAPEPAYREASPRPGILSSLFRSFEGEIDKIKQTAIGALMGAARDMLKQALPPALAENVDEIMNNVTRRAGGEPIRGPVLQSEAAGRGDGSRGTAY
jgi:hypothetical protein